MLGVCITVVSVVRLLEVNASIGTVIDNIIAIDSILFLLAAMLSYLSIRSVRRWRMETYADITFMLALVIMTIASVLLAWELG